MSKYPLPGTLWVGFFLALVPAVSAVLAEYFPEAQYWWSPVIVTLLAATAKAIQVAMTQPKTLPIADEPDAADLQLMAAAAAAPRPPDGDDYTYEAIPQRSKLQRWLLG